MGALGRPPTLKEFVIQSILARREPAPTLVDLEDQAPTGELPCEAYAPYAAYPEPPPLPPARASQASVVFDLVSPPPRRRSSPSFADDEQRDTLPSPPPSPW